jgi:hypothetical protein
MKHLKDFENYTLLESDTSATGGLAVGGMGAVVSAQPSGLAGATIGTNWYSSGGTEGSGDISAQYNPGGLDHKLQQKIPMSKGHGPRTGKKSREKKLDLKAIKNVLSKRQDYTKGSSKASGEKKNMEFCGSE